MRSRSSLTMFASVLVAAGLVLSSAAATADDAPAEIGRVTGRRPQTDEDLSYWLTNSVQHHRLSMGETALSLGMSETDVQKELERLKIVPNGPAPAHPGDTIKVLPYPGGRHPRIGFLEGAIDPQRETKVSVFTPWQPAGNEQADFVV